MKHTINLDDEASFKVQRLADRDRRSFNNLVAKWIEERLLIEWTEEQQQQKEQEK